jgi:multidrug efflux system outer membrane protein
VLRSRFRPSSFAAVVAPFLVVGVTAVAAPAARGDDRAATPDGADVRLLDPARAVALALSRSDDVKRAALDVEIARVEETALNLRSPELQIGHRSLNAIGGAQVDPFDDSQIGLSWQPPALEDLGLRQAIGARRADAGRRDVDEVAVSVAVEVRTLHAQVLALRAERALAAQRAALLEQVATLQTRRVEAQVGTALDVELTSLDLLDARADIADLGGDLARLEQRLARLLGEPALPELAPPPSPLCTLPAAGLAAAQAQARERSPRLRAIALREESLGLRETRAWLRWVPWIDAVQVGALAQEEGAEFRARVDIALPLFAPLSPDLRLTSLERERLAADRRAVERELDERLRSAWDRLQGFVQLVDVYDAAADRIDASQRAVERSLAAEVVDTLRVATVQQRVLSARRQAMRSRARCDEAAIAFAAAAGDALAAVAPVDTLR